MKIRFYLSELEELKPVSSVTLLEALDGTSLLEVAVENPSELIVKTPYGNLKRPSETLRKGAYYIVLKWDYSLK